MNKRDLIYQAASEAVMKSRIEISKYLKERISSKDADLIDRELSLAMHRAGQYALKAYDCDARKISSLPQLLNQPNRD